ncbi:DUF3196 family protein [Amphibacillus sediminis]|uniref:DUF3196 family protein n=1 Tax=Amphibacillus sediminis TaxID=360185 RepID=UPI00082F0699|nr:DUF3196 family protein [Amphibacillus sediminis]
MNEKQKNIVLFPKQRQELEQQGYQAIQDKDYRTALKLFNQLLEFGATDQEIALGKLTSLIELGRQREAEQFCETLIALKDDHYYSYINIYATLLFQFHKHKEVAQLLTEVLEDRQIPDSFESQLKKLFEVNQPLVDEQIEQEVVITKRELTEALKNQDTMAQWHLVNHLQKVDIKPYLALFEEMLKNETVHPVIKTVIVGLLQASAINREFSVSKFGQQLQINPTTYPYMSDHPFRTQLKEGLANIEQDNPSFYAFANKLIDRYFYVHYPMVPEHTELEAMQVAVIAIVEASFDPQQSLNEAEYDPTTIKMINRLVECEQIYFSIMAE